MKRILIPSPEQRLTIDEIRAHPWYQQVKVREFQGILVGKNPIPVDMDIVAMISQFEQVDEQQARKFVANNRHNPTTTIYYLLLKRHLRKGGNSIADITKYNPDKFKLEHPNPVKCV